MYVVRFYPHTMQRSWAVMDITGKPHSLWLRLRDAEEMAERLDVLEDPRNMYRALVSAQDPQTILGWTPKLREGRRGPYKPLDTTQDQQGVLGHDRKPAAL